MHIAVLSGGDSAEREASLWTSKFVEPALGRLGHTYEVMEPHEVLGQGRRFDLAFNCLHGGSGEDGRVQGALSVVGVPQTGSPVLASALAMDKRAFKSFASAFGVSAPTELMPGRSHDFAKVIVKPTSGGGSLDTYLLDAGQQPEIDRAAAEPHLLVEEFVVGPVVTVALIEVKGETQALPPVVVRLTHEQEFYDAESKYGEALVDLTLMSAADDAYQQLQATSSMLFEAAGFRGYARFDFVLDPARGPVLLEANSLPGLYPGSNFCFAASAVGLELDDVIELIIEAAVHDSVPRATERSAGA